MYESVVVSHHRHEWMVAAYAAVEQGTSAEIRRKTFCQSYGLRRQEYCLRVRRLKELKTKVVHT